MSKKTPLSIVILAAGKGTRMKSSMPKVMHKLAGRPMINWILETAEALSPEKIVVVSGPGMDDLVEAVKPHASVVQKDRRGTGDAVKAALPELKGFKGDVLILLGDMPLITQQTLEMLIEARHENGMGLSVLGADFEVPPPFGRLVQNADNTLARIVEDKDASQEDKQITLCNTGAFCIDGEKLAGWLEKIGTNNAQGEYYITDLPEIALADGFKTAVAVTTIEEEVYGVNCRSDLAELETMLQDILRADAMDNGATLLDPNTVYFSWDTLLGQDVIVGQNVVFGPGVEVDDNVIIHAFSHLEGVKIEQGVQVGPFARLRPGTVLSEGVKIGNFVETKNAVMGKGAKANHLSYIGDAEVGAGANVGAGTITCNYDGYDKHKTIIGQGVFVGSNSTLVAPVSIADGAYIAAGSCISEDVPENALSVARSRQIIRDGWAALYRERKQSKKKSA